MGEKDIERLHKVYRACVDFTKLAELPFTFKVDSGNFETAIEFFYDDDEKWHTLHPPSSQDWQTNPTIICPDILIMDCFQPLGVIEFEEESGNRRSGAKLARKGHGHEGDLDTKRDSKRNEFYKNAGFRVLRIWESHYNHNAIWKLKLFRFLMDCTKEKIKC